METNRIHLILSAIINVPSNNLPTPLDEEKIPCFCGVKDLSSTEKAKDEDVSMVFSFGAFEEMSGK